jgi:hypothetical protein
MIDVLHDYVLGTCWFQTASMKYEVVNTIVNKIDETHFDVTEHNLTKRKK